MTTIKLLAIGAFLSAVVCGAIFVAHDIIESRKQSADYIDEKQAVQAVRELREIFRAAADVSKP